MMTTIELRESHINAADQTPLFLRELVPGGPEKATILFTHGMGEHSERYMHVAEFLAHRGYRFCAYDLRGHGRSQGRRGYIASYGELLDDLKVVMAHYVRQGEPVFLYGHSMGAQVTLNFLEKRKPAIQGAIITSPWLELSFRPSPFKVLLAKIMLNVWPTFTQEGPNDNKLLSHDVAFIDTIPGKELLHHKMSARMYDELTRGAREARDGAADCDFPLLLIHGAEDPMTSMAASKIFFSKVKSQDKTLKIYPSMLHETHNEIGREDVMAGMAAWLDARVS